MTAVRFGQEAVLPHQVTVSSSRISNPFAPNGSLPQSAVASSHVTFPSPVVSYVPRGLVFFAEPYPPIRSNSASVRKFPVNIGTKQKSGEADRPRFAQQIGVLPKPARSGFSVERTRRTSGSGNTAHMPSLLLNARTHRQLVALSSKSGHWHLATLFS